MPLDVISFRFTHIAKVLAVMPFSYVYYDHIPLNIYKFSYRNNGIGDMIVQYNDKGFRAPKNDYVFPF